ncbi:MAG: HD domain-containing protein [Desulfurivibrionaceae bacterium]|nr:HD domain-containing protein [Desulfobulbales bacterium]MDT8335244.1 HD domain-containing protein [Desulfurivibrionaceae bacterium]
MMNCSVNKGFATGARQNRGVAPPPLPDARLREIAAGYCEGAGDCHGMEHVDRVHATAVAIGKAMNGRLNILSGAAILHDIGRRDESRSRGGLCHAARGAALAEKILRDLGFKGDDVTAICHCIATHRYRDANPPQSLEAKILFDADKLDAIGAVGIGRAFLFAGRIGAKLHNPNIDIDSTVPYTVEDTAYREFRIKLCKIRERMLTPLGRQLAEERHQFMKIFFARLESEINGGVPDVQGS